MFMFFGIAILEDAGYLARLAFMLDRVFRVFGLHGSSVMPFILSGGIAGGCAVPGIMAARTVRSPKERLATLLTVPFMNCGAKLPVFALLMAAFFSKHEVMVILAISILLWAMMTFPTLPVKDSQDFETRRQTLGADSTPGLIQEIQTSGKIR